MVAPEPPPAPPPEERPPAPAPDDVWAPGYWYWYDSHYVWIDGGWIAPRPGYVYVNASWGYGADGWLFAPGGWSIGFGSPVAYPVYRHYWLYSYPRPYYGGYGRGYWGPRYGDYYCHRLVRPCVSAQLFVPA